MQARRPKREITGGTEKRKAPLRLIDSNARLDLRTKVLADVRRLILKAVADRDVAANVEHAVHRYFGLKPGPDAEAQARDQANADATIALENLREAVEGLREVVRVHAAVPDEAKVLVRVVEEQDDGPELVARESVRPLIGALANARRYLATHGQALDAAPRTINRAPPHEWAAIDLVIAQLWQELNGGPGHCRVCDTALRGTDGCRACGAEQALARLQHVRVGPTLQGTVEETPRRKHWQET